VDALRQSTPKLNVKH